MFFFEDVKRLRLLSINFRLHYRLRYILRYKLRNGLRYGIALQLKVTLQVVFQSQSKNLYYVGGSQPGISLHTT